MNELHNRYRNVSGTILMINDMNHFQIPINGIVDVEHFDNETINNSIDFRQHIAMNNLVPDNTEKKAVTIPRIQSVKKEIDLDTIKLIAEEIGKSIAGQLGKNNSDELVSLIKKLIKNNPDIEENINSSTNYKARLEQAHINKLQNAMNQQYNNVKEPSPAKEKERNSISDEEDINELKKLLSKED